MQTMRICFVGDSFVNGTGDRECLGWTGRIVAAASQNQHDITYYNLGVRRETSTDIKRRWRAEVSCRLPPECDGRVVFSFGANDTTVENGKVRVKLEDSIQNSRQILQEANDLFPVLMVSSPPLADDEQNVRIARLSRELALVCAELNIPYLDVFTPLQRSQTWMNEAAAYDGAHPRTGGYVELANLVQNWISWLFWFKQH